MNLMMSEKLLSNWKKTGTRLADQEIFETEVAKIAGDDNGPKTIEKRGW